MTDPSFDQTGRVISLMLGDGVTFQFTVTDGEVSQSGQLIEFANFTGQCKIEIDSSASSNRGPDYAAGGKSVASTMVSTGDAATEEETLSVSVTSKLLNASILSGEDDESNVVPAGKVQIQSEYQYAASLIKREKVNFYNANKSKKNTLNFNDPLMLDYNDNDSKASNNSLSVDSSITNSVLSATSSVSLFSVGNTAKLRKMTAFQPFAANRELSQVCNVSGEPFSKMIPGRKRHNCRYCKDCVSTAHSVIDQKLPVPFKGVRLCMFCYTDVMNGRYRTLRRFYTSLIYLKPLCDHLLEMDYDKIRVALTALSRELDMYLIKQGGNISIPPDLLIQAMGRHVYYDSNPLVPVDGNSMKFRDFLYMGVRILASMLAIGHTIGDYRYACEAHKGFANDVTGFVNIPQRLLDILSINETTLKEKLLPDDVPIKDSNYSSEEELQEELTVCTKAVAIAQEQACRVLFYMTHPKVVNDPAFNIKESEMNKKLLITTLLTFHNDDVAVVPPTHMMKRFAAACLSNFVLMSRDDGSMFLRDPRELRKCMNLLCYLLATSEDIDARVHAVGAMHELMRSSHESIDLSSMILDSVDFNYFSLAELLTLGDALIIETTLAFLCLFVGNATENDDISVAPSIDLSNENSLLKALVALMDSDTSSPEIKLMVMTLFANMISGLVKGKDNGTLPNIEEGFKNMETERIIDSAFRTIQPPNTLSSTDSISANIRQAAGYVVYKTYCNGSMTTASSSGSIVKNSGASATGSNSNSLAPSQSQSVRWGNIVTHEEDVGDSLTRTSITDLPNLENGSNSKSNENTSPNKLDLRLHKILSKKFFTLKQVDYILSSNIDVARTVDLEHKSNDSNSGTGMIPLQVLAANKDYLTSGNHELKDVVTHLVHNYAKGLIHQDERALFPFFAAINDWAIFAQRGYESSIFQQNRTHKLNRLRGKDVGEAQINAPRIEMPPFVVSSLQCLSYIVDHMGYPGMRNGALLEQVDLVQLVAQVNDLMKLLFFIDDHNVRDRVLNMSIVQRALMYDDYILADNWILEMPQDKYQIFVEKWLYSFDVAKARFRKTLERHPEILAVEEAKRKNVVQALLSKIESARKAIKKKKKREAFMKRYLFLIYYLDFER